MNLRAGYELLSGRYRIVRLIGKGGFALVYLAYDTVLERQVAIKELGTAPVTDNSVIGRFIAEGKAAMLLRHRSILKVYDVFREGGGHYLAMEHLPGGWL
jgi:serine/threonine protein kinase